MEKAQQIGQAFGITTDLAKEMLDESPKDYLWIEWLSLCDCAKEYNRVPRGSVKEGFILERWISRCNTIDEVWVPLAKAARGSLAQDAGLGKWEEFSLVEVRAAKTLEDCKKAYQRCRLGSPAQEVALEKWIRLSETIEDIRDALSRAPTGSELERIAIKEWDKLSLQEVQAATSIEALALAHNRARPASDPRRIAVRKAGKLIDG